LHLNVLPLIEGASYRLKEKPFLFWKVHGSFADVRHMLRWGIMERV